MELALLETTFEVIDVVDTFESLIWTDRYSGFGDFEIFTPVNAKIVASLIEKRYLQLDDSEHLMIIEDIGIDSDIENGNKVIVKGRSVETILERRRVYPPMILTGDLEDSIKAILDNNIIAPTDTDRTIANFVFEYSGDPLIEAMVVDDQFGPDKSVYEAIVKICTLNGLGFKVTIDDSGIFTFVLYLGIDRSYEQFDNPYVVFSPKFENILNGSYRETNVFEKNVGYVAGEKGIGNESIIVVVTKDDQAWSGLERREMFTDAGSITRNVPDTDPLTEEEYADKLTEKGKQDLSENVFFQAFDGQIDTLGLYIYGLDYNMGDIVQVANEYGHEARSRVTEIIHSQDVEGTRKYPTFSTVA